MGKDKITPETLAAAREVFEKIAEVKVEGYTEKYMVDYTKEDLCELADLITDEEGWVEVPVDKVGDEEIIDYAMTIKNFNDSYSSLKLKILMMILKKSAKKEKSFTDMNKSEIKEFVSRVEKANVAIKCEKDKTIVFVSSRFFVGE